MDGSRHGSSPRRILGRYSRVRAAVEGPRQVFMSREIQDILGVGGSVRVVGIRTAVALDVVGVGVGVGVVSVWRNSKVRLQLWRCAHLPAAMRMLGGQAVVRPTTVLYW